MSWLNPSEYELKMQREAAARNRQADHEAWLRKQFDNYGSAKETERHCQLWAGDSALLDKMEEDARLQEEHEKAFVKGLCSAPLPFGGFQENPFDE